MAFPCLEKGLLMRVVVVTRGLWSELLHVPFSTCVFSKGELAKM